MAEEPISLKGRLEVLQYEFNELFAYMLDLNFRCETWKYIKENHPETYARAKEQIERADRESEHETIDC